MEEIWKKPEVQALGEERIRLLHEAQKESEGKSGLERLDVLLEYGEKLADGGALSKAEQQALLSAVSATMPESERIRMTQVMAILGL